MQEWSLTDLEISNQRNECYDKKIPGEEFEERMAPVLIQGIAALEPASLKDILARITVLKILKPTRNMAPDEEKVFLRTITEHIFLKQINYQFIDRGIFNLLEDKKLDKWFPDLPIILEFIEKEHRQFRNRIMKLNELLLRRRTQKLLK